MNKKIVFLVIIFLTFFLSACGHEMVKVDKKAPTCDEKGYTEHYKCADDGCDYLEGYQEIEALGHNFIHYEGREATCISDGYTEYDYCLRCFKKVGYEEIEALGHKLVKVEGLASTKTQLGYSRHYKCERCDYTEGLEYIPCKLEVTDRYFVKKLNEDLLNAFLKMYNGAISFEKEVYFDTPIPKDDFSYLMILLNYSCPELIQINGDYNYSYNELGVTMVKFTYILDQTEYVTKLDEINNLVKEIINEIGNLSDFEKELYVYNYIIDKTKYEKNNKYSGSIYGCLVNGVARCEGYSKAFMYLMNALGIECHTITGYANERHSWNIIKLEDKYYFCDPTWDDLGNNETTLGLFNVDHNTMINASHIVDEEFIEMANKCNSLDMSISYRNGTYLNKEKDVLSNLYNLIDICIKCGDKKIYIKVETSEQFNVLKTNVERIMKEYLDSHYNTWSYDLVYHGDGKTYMFKLSYSSPK